MASSERTRVEINAGALWAIAALVVGVEALIAYVLVNANMPGNYQFVGIVMMVGLALGVVPSSVSFIVKGPKAKADKDE